MGANINNEKILTYKAPRFCFVLSGCHDALFSSCPHYDFSHDSIKTEKKQHTNKALTNDLKGMITKLEFASYTFA